MSGQYQNNKLNIFTNIHPVVDFVKNQRALWNVIIIQKENVIQSYVYAIYLLLVTFSDIYKSSDKFVLINKCCVYFVENQ